MPRKRNYKCLLVKTRDKRNFFTHEKNLPELIEFSKTFGAEISVVQVKEAEVLDLVKLGTAICDTAYAPQQRPDYEILETKIPTQTRKRSRILKTSQKIRDFIKNEFLKGKVVSLQTLKKRFNRHQLTSACLCNHMKVVREELEDEGYSVKKVGGGKYQIC